MSKITGKEIAPYFIEYSIGNFIPKLNFKRETKEGEEKISTTSFGYFANIEGALNKIAELKSIDVLEDTGTMEVKAFVTTLKDIRYSLLKLTKSWQK